MAVSQEEVVMKIDKELKVIFQVRAGNRAKSLHGDVVIAKDQVDEPEEREKAADDDDSESEPILSSRTKRKRSLARVATGEASTPTNSKKAKLAIIFVHASCDVTFGEQRDDATANSSPESAENSAASSPGPMLDNGMTAFGALSRHQQPRSAAKTYGNAGAGAIKEEGNEWS